jgi:DNA-binding NarL/FixJ family response regulator
VLSAQPDFMVVGEACNGDEALKLIVQLHPDVLLLDLCMPIVSGLDVLRCLWESDSDVRTIVLSVELEAQQIPRFLKLGVRGFVPKGSPSAILFNSIRAVMTGEYWIHSQSVSNPDQMQRSRQQRRPKISNFGLTGRNSKL